MNSQTQQWEERTTRRLRVRLWREVLPKIRAYQAQGGPRPEDYERVRSYSTDLAAHGDIILFPNGKGNDEPLLDKLTDGVAVLSFCPGGVTVFGLTFEAEKIRQDRPQDELQSLMTYINQLLSL